MMSIGWPGSRPAGGSTGRLAGGLVAGLAALLVAASVSAATPSVVPKPPQVNARAYVLMDYRSGRILAESNADERLEPASLTKMMTVYVVLAELAEGKLGLEDQVRVSEKAWKMRGSKTFLEVDDRVSVELLLKGVIVQSGNDASVALAEHVAGDETVFASLMNEYATRLGMTGTHFANASGWPHPENYTTARDMALMAVALIRDFPEHYSWHSIREFEYNGIKQANRNRLLFRDSTVDGLKTGHTESAGYCLVASAVRNDMRLVSVLMGADSEKSRARLSQSLLDFGYRFYESLRIYGAGEPVTKVRVWQGERPELGLGVREDFYVTVPRGAAKKLVPRITPSPRIKAPVTRGSTLGVVSIHFEDESLGKRTLVALEDIPKGSLWQQVSDYVRLFFE